MQYDFEQFFPKDECFGKIYSSFLGFTCNYERTSETLSPGTGLHLIWSAQKIPVYAYLDLGFNMFLIL